MITDELLDKARLGHQQAAREYREAGQDYILACDAEEMLEREAALMKDGAVERRRATMDALNQKAWEAKIAANPATVFGKEPKPTSYEAAERTVMLDPEYANYVMRLRSVKVKRRRLEQELTIARSLMFAAVAELWAVVQAPTGRPSFQ